MAELTQIELESWITNSATGKFHYTGVMDGQVKPELYPNIRVMMKRAKEKGIVVPVGDKDGWWRPVDKNLEELCWWDGDGEIGESIILPLGLNKYCHIPLPSIILLAGKYNSGKTAFCINVVNCNLEKWGDKLDFYVSEGAEMMKAKFQALNSYIPKPPPFKMYRRTENFSDIIVPNHLSVIDYLRVNMEQPYAIGNEIFRIFNRVGEKGIAVVSMQKPPGERKLAFGGAATAFEPSLYLGMDKDVIGFEKIKVPKITTFDPYHLKISFKIKNGVNFIDVNETVE